MIFQSCKARSLSLNQLTNQLTNKQKLTNSMQQSSPCEVVTPHSVKKCLVFYGTLKFITVITTAFHLFLLPTKLPQSMSSYLISLAFTLIPSSHLRLSLPSYLYQFPYQNSVCISFPPILGSRSAHLILLGLTIRSLNRTVLVSFTSINRTMKTFD